MFNELKQRPLYVIEEMLNEPTSVSGLMAEEMQGDSRIAVARDTAIPLGVSGIAPAETPSSRGRPDPRVRRTP